MERTAVRCLYRASLLLSCWAIAAFASSNQLAVEGAPGTTYYVDSESGSDTNDGTSPDSPFRTLERATAALDRSGTPRGPSAR